MTPWIYHYKCGCSDGPKPKHEMLDYCGIHGGDVTEKIKMPKCTKGEPRG